MDSYSEYTDLVDHISERDGATGHVGSDGERTFMDLVTALLVIRRKGEEIRLRHMGKLLEDRRLKVSDFQ